MKTLTRLPIYLPTPNIHHQHGTTGPGSFPAFVVVIRITFAGMKATYLIRVPSDLKDALLKAGADHVRNTLAAAYCNTDERNTEGGRITKGRNTDVLRKDVIREEVPVIQGNVIQKAEGVPSWRAKLEQDRERLASVKAAKDQARAESEQGRGL